MGREEWDDQLVSRLSELHKEKDMKYVEEFGGLEGICKLLETDPRDGLPHDPIERAVEQRKSVFGENVLPRPPPKPLWFFLWEATKDPTLVILAIAAVISTLLGIFFEDEATGWIEGVAILIAISIVVLVTGLNDWSKDKKFRKLNEKKDDRQCTIRRGGETIQIQFTALVVGDVVSLETGEFVPADGLFLDGHNMRIDESAMTGETDAISKRSDKPFMLSGTKVMEGVGRYVVTSVGPHSQWGEIVTLLQEDDEGSTPLQEKLELIANLIGKVGVYSAVATFAALLLKYCIDLGTGDEVWDTGPSMELIVKFFVTAITILVVAVPEGLPLAVTISLAYSMMKMMRDQNLVRHLDACETMGGATNICSDKTGTLTENRMTVTQGWFGGRTFNNALPNKSDFTDEEFDALTVSICRNSTAQVYRASHDAPYEFVGNKTECALLVMCKEWGVDYEPIRTKFDAVQVLPFSSARKRMSAIIASPNGPKKYRLFTKGASEIVLKRCSKMLDHKNGVVSLSDAHCDRLIDDVITPMAASGLRTLTLAYRDLDSCPADGVEDGVEEDLVLLCIVGIKDPVRKEVPGAVAKCQRAGITVRMVTGDNILTAKHIARECGILTDDGIALEGPDFRKMTDDELFDIVERLQVLARSSPQDKHRLVRFLKMHNEVVAVTGDGTNDAPALREADVGFSMGIAGTEVAKDASDIILMDDNFNSIVKAVLWGRNVYDSIRKFVQFQLTVNVVALATAFISALSTGESVLTAVQLLWVNLIMDTFGALALATEPPAEEMLERPPYGRKDSLITPVMWKNILGQGFFQLIVLLIFTFAGHEIFGEEKFEPHSDDPSVHGTLIFNVFVFMQVFNEINARKISNDQRVFAGLLENPMFMGILIVTVILQVIMVQFGGKAIFTKGLTAGEWIACIVIGMISLPFGYLLRSTRLEEKYLNFRLKGIEDVEDEDASSETVPLAHMERGDSGYYPSNINDEVQRALGEIPPADPTGRHHATDKGLDSPRKKLTFRQAGHVIMAANRFRVAGSWNALNLRNRARSHSSGASLFKATDTSSRSSVRSTGSSGHSHGD